MKPVTPAPMTFATPDEWNAWLSVKHDKARDLWLRIGKKGSGTVSITIAAPSTPGSYTVTATATPPPLDPTALVDPCADVAQLEITVQSAGPVLPGTGSNTTMPGLQIALLSVVVGGALLGLATLRRRKLSTQA